MRDAADPPEDSAVWSQGAPSAHDELHASGVRLVLYPLSAFRAAARAMLEVYGAIRRDGTQAALVDRMQTRAELYDVLRYHDYEKKLDELFGRNS